MKYSQYHDRPKFNFGKAFLKTFILSAVVLTLGWFLIGFLISPINRILGLPNVSKLESYTPISSIEVYDRNDELVSVIQSEEDRQIVPIDRVSTSLKQAVMASEDHAFYQHHGINFLGIIRAAITNFQSGKLKQGGSTITQQLVKNVYFPPKEWNTLRRKVLEVLLALEVEQKFSKDKIFEIYLNQIYWGKAAYGIERAAKRYFNKNASQLNVAESAYLVALLPSPSNLNDTPEAYQRQKAIIENMYKYGYITQGVAQEAYDYKLKFESSPGNLAKFPYYINVVIEELRSRFSEHDLSRLGLRVYTAIDPVAQEVAEKMLAEAIKKAPSGINQGALVTIDVASNEARVIVGGVGDFWKYQWNRATSPHTLGSAFKPFVYLTAFIKGYMSSSTQIMDTPYVYDEEGNSKAWNPRNFDGKYWGEMTVRKALVNSRNVPAVRAAAQVGIGEVIKVAEKLGIDGVQPYLSSALGTSAVSPLKAANAYAALARGGIYMKPVVIRRIVDRNDHVLEQNTPVPEQVLPAKPIYELIDVLVDVVDHGTGVAAKIPKRQVAGKTGTADDSKDVWFIGFSPDTVTALWAGNDLNKKASFSATGGVVLAGLWKRYMEKYYEENLIPATYFPKPAPKVKRLIDPITGLLATSESFQPENREFVPGTEPTEYAPDPTSEQIQDYLKKVESERGYLLDENEEDLKSLEALEQEMLADIDQFQREQASIKANQPLQPDNSYIPSLRASEEFAKSPSPYLSPSAVANEPITNPSPASRRLVDRIPFATRLKNRLEKNSQASLNTGPDPSQYNASPTVNAPDPSQPSNNQNSRDSQGQGKAYQNPYLEKTKVSQ